MLSQLCADLQLFNSKQFPSVCEPSFWKHLISCKGMFWGANFNFLLWTNDRHKINTSQIISIKSINVLGSWYCPKTQIISSLPNSFCNKDNDRFGQNFRKTNGNTSPKRTVFIRIALDWPVLLHHEIIPGYITHAWTLQCTQKGWRREKNKLNHAISKLSRFFFWLS